MGMTLAVVDKKSKCRTGSGLFRPPGECMNTDREENKRMREKIQRAKPTWEVVAWPQGGLLKLFHTEEDAREYAKDTNHIVRKCTE